MRDIERVTAVGGLPFDPSNDSAGEPIALGADAGAGPAVRPRGITFTPVPSVTNHVSDSSIQAFGRAVMSRAQLCRPIGTPTTVTIELLVNDLCHRPRQLGVLHIGEQQVHRHARRLLLAVRMVDQQQIEMLLDLLQPPLRSWAMEAQHA